MFFQIGNRIVEVRKSHIIIGASIVLALLALLGILSFKKDVFSFMRTTAFIAIMAYCLIVCLIFLAIRFGLFSRLKPGFEFDYKVSTFSSNMKKGVKEYGVLLIVFVIMFSAIFYFSVFGLPRVNMPSINIPICDVKQLLPEKEPTVENPKPSTEEVVSSTVKRATTTTTTTTRKKPSAEGRTSGFFVYKKEAGVEYRDCSFDGKGHDAILMPSGNYYCRSTEQRMTIKVDGVEKICCVAP